METFDFPYHLVSTEYPDSATRVQFGSSYVFTSKPVAPDQRIFTLSFQGMGFFFSGEILNRDVKPQLNMGTLERFYQDHQTWKSFIYPHALLGSVVCKFHQPLTIPKGVPGGSGKVEGFELKLIEVP